MRHDHRAALSLLSTRISALTCESRVLIVRARAQQRYALATCHRARELSGRIVNGWVGAQGLTAAGQERTGDDGRGLVLDTARARFGGCGLIRLISLTTVDQLGGDEHRSQTAASTGIAGALDRMQYWMDVAIDEIARAAHIGRRGLQAAFRNHLDQTPMEYLRRVRMRRVHPDPVAGDPTAGDTVTDIAARWRFSPAGRFSVDYRRSYGCPPSATLRR